MADVEVIHWEAMGPLRQPGRGGSPLPPSHREEEGKRPGFRAHPDHASAFLSQPQKLPGKGFWSKEPAAKGCQGLGGRP